MRSWARGGFAVAHQQTHSRACAQPLGHEADTFSLTHTPQLRQTQTPTTQNSDMRAHTHPSCLCTDKGSVCVHKVYCLSILSMCSERKRQSGNEGEGEVKVTLGTMPGNWVHIQITFLFLHTMPALSLRHCSIHLSLLFPFPPSLPLLSTFLRRRNA